MDTFRLAQATDLGMTRAQVYRRVRRGELVRVARGLYRAATAAPADHDLVEAAARRPDAVICLTSALSLHELIDDIPDALDVAIPRPSRIPATHSAIRWHLFDRACFAVGRREYQVPGTDLTLGLYSPERSIVDALRLRGRQGYETGPAALREWLRRGGRPADLLAVAQQIPRAAGPVRTALEYLA